MQLISWNMWSKNKFQTEDLQTIFSWNPEVICLQEVTQKSLDFALSNGWQAAVALDYKDNRQEQYSLVTLSKRPFEGQFKAFMSEKKPQNLATLTHGLQEVRQFQYVDLSLEDQEYRIFNVHLEVACGPKMRLQQFQRLLQSWGEDKINLICGDFNIFAQAEVSWLLGWYFGFGLQEYTIDEREEFEKLFAQYKLKNPFAGQVTYPKFRLQLDHILLPQKSLIKEQKIVTSLHSDHYLLKMVL